MERRARVQVHDLWVDLREFHLREINLEIAAGEYFVVLGPTGAGKTVLLETLAGLHSPHRGRILLNGEDLTPLPPERRGIGFVYQDYALFPHLSVAENIAFGLKLQREGRAQDPGPSRRLVIERRVEEISRLLAIEPLLVRRPQTLSGGEQQRVALARALVIEPRLLLLDEPLSALDPQTREGLQRELARLHRELGTTTLHVTHDFEEAAALGDRIAVVNAGRVVQVGAPGEIFRKPASEFVARFVGARNIFQGELCPGEGGDSRLSFAGMQLAVVTDLVGQVQVVIRPEDLILSREPRRSDVCTSCRGRVVELVDKGTLVYVTVSFPFDGAPASSCDFVGVITHRSLEELELQEGTEVYLAFKASAVHLIPK